MTKPLTLALIGCGGRGTTYLSLAGERPDRYRVVAAADPDEFRLNRVAGRSNNPEFRGFRDAEEILAEPQLADVMVIGTQDAYHCEHAIASMESGYDLLLEKPIAPNKPDMDAIHAVADRLGRRVMVCHVLRFTPFYRKVKSLVDSGKLGDLISLNATEGVEAWHYAHSFVRGPWAVSAESSPMILAKSCHDLDIIRWLVGAPCESLSSFGDLMHFTVKNKPEGAPTRCLMGCPVANRCPYNAERYLTDRSSWMFVAPFEEDADEATRLDWLNRSPWGRCVYQCDNDVVDHQTINMRFKNDVKATFTMTAFDEGRNIEIFGSKARLIGGPRIKQGYGCDILIAPHAVDTEPERYSVEIVTGGYDSHMGGDTALVDSLYDEMRGDESCMTTSLAVSIDSHDMAFAAEEARLNGTIVYL